MDIYVQATAEKAYKPNIVNLSFNFEVLSKTYETALKNGALAVEEFVKLLNTFKINIGMCLIGVVMGEFLTSKAGIGYLILYGSQVFNLTLVMSGIFILLILSVILYSFISIIEKHLDF